MAKFEDLGYCPCNEIVHSQRKAWLGLSDEGKGQRTGFWSMIGEYLVCAKAETVSEVNEPGKIFFDTVSLADKVLVALIKRYNFTECRPIWIKRPVNKEIGEYILEVKDRQPEVIISSFDAGKLVVISNGDNYELVLAYWDISYDI